MIKNLIGQKFGRLTVIKDSGKRSKSREIIWECKCECGRLTKAINGNLKTGNTKSCGCLQKENQNALKHGDRCKGKRSRLYVTWDNMMGRCNNLNNKKYRTYGKLGTTVCEEWKDYLNFKNWALNNGYQDNLTIDRIDCYGNYCPDNCQFITNSQNAGKRKINQHKLGIIRSNF